MSWSGHVLGPLKVITSLTNCTNPESAIVFTERKWDSSWGSDVSKMKQLGSGRAGVQMQICHSQIRDSSHCG